MEQLADQGFFAVHKQTGKLYIGKTSQVAYTELRYLKTAIKYHSERTGFTQDDFYYYILKPSGIVHIL